MEPERAHDQDHGLADPLEVEHDAQCNAECDPHAEQRERRDGEPAETPEDEAADVLASLLCAAPRHEVPVAADVEEERHHLQQPRGHPEPGGEADGVGGVGTVVLPDDDREHPVPRDHHQQAERSHEVDVVVAAPRKVARVGGGLGRLAADQVAASTVTLGP
jgi:hypothetical protein